MLLFFTHFIGVAGCSSIPFLNQAVYLPTLPEMPAPTLPERQGGGGGVGGIPHPPMSRSQRSLAAPVDGAPVLRRPESASAGRNGVRGLSDGQGHLPPHGNPKKGFTRRYGGPSDHPLSLPKRTTLSPSLSLSPPRPPSARVWSEKEF